MFCFELEKPSSGLDYKPWIKTLGELMQREYKQGFVLLASQDPTWIMVATHSKQEDNPNTVLLLELAIQVMLSWNVLPTSKWDTLKERWLNCKYLVKVKLPLDCSLLICSPGLTVMC